MSRIGVALLAVCLAAGCVGPQEQRVASAPVEAMLHLDVTGDRADRPADDDADASARDAAGSAEPGAADNGVLTSTPPTPEAVAAEEVVRLVELEGLLVYELRPESESSDETTAVLEVGVVYGTGRGHPTSTTYRVAVRHVERQWTVTSIEELPSELLP